MNKYLKTAITSLTAGLLVLTAIPTPASAVTIPKKADSWDGTADTSWYDSEADSFSIDTAEALAGLAELVNAGDPMTGKSFYLERDLLLNVIGNYENWDTEPPANNWESIGTDKSAPFDGIFYGQGNTICGMYQKTAQMNDHNIPFFCGGIFGTISENAEISGIDCRYAYVHLENEQIVPENTMHFEISAAYAGGISGGMWHCVNIESSYNTGNIYASTLFENTSSDLNAYSGGIAGNSYAKIEEQQGSIRNCYNTGIISSNGPIDNASSGGILGGTDAQYMDYTAKIVNCYYLDTTSDRCFGMGDADDFAQSDEEMKTELFAGLLWEAFYYQPNHYPILTWEAGKTPDTGDVNGDGLFTLSDVVMMQKFILGGEYLTVPQAGDVCMDLRLDGFDLAVMKRLLLLSE